MKIRQVRDFETIAGQLAQCLRHQARLQSHLRIAHLPFEFRLGHQRGHRVHHHHIHAAGADQRFRNFQRLLAIVRLRNQQIVHIHAQLSRVHRIERVLGVDKRRLAAQLLRFGDHVQRHSGLAARFRAVNLNHASARKAADAQRRINRQTAAGNYADRHQHIATAQPHDGAFAVRLFDLRDRRFQ